MGRKVIIDCDPGIADAVALCMALFDARLEVLATTAVAGCVQGPQATENLQAILDQLDSPRMPRVGSAGDLEQTATDDAGAFSTQSTMPAQGADGLGNANLEAVRHRSHLSEKLIVDTVRANSEAVTILCLGPLTNVARALQREPMLASMLDRIVIAGGCSPGFGNITPAAEFNIHADPQSAWQVFQSTATKTLIPLEVSRIPIDMSILDELPSEHTPAGKLLRHILSFAFRAYRQGLGTESIFLPEAIATVALLNSELFETEEVQGEVETNGQSTTGATIFDRRPHVATRSNMELAVSADPVAVTDCLVRALRQAS